ncbi:MAG: WbqC family protein [Chitinophagaceae bacterium]|nr:WbqC family protein [Chitinophagaceae bacterium]
MNKIIEIQYFPIVDWFKIATNSSHFRIDIYENFKKMSFRNRCLISGSNGLINLTVPLVKGREQKSLITEIKVDDSEPWRAHHWKAIVSSYSRSPFFEFYGQEIKKLIFAPNPYLFEHNLKIIGWFNSVLKLGISIEFTESYKKEYEATAATDYRNKWLPKNYARDGNDWQPRYTQVFSDKFGFMPNLSILDLLFCKGSL